LWFGISTQVNEPGGVVLMRQETDFQFGPVPPLEVVTETLTDIVPPGDTVTLAPPFKVAELTVRPSVKPPDMETADVNPTAV